MICKQEQTMKKRNLLLGFSALSLASALAFASVRMYQPVQTWHPSDDYEFEEGGCVIGFWYNDNFKSYSVPKLLPGYLAFPMHSMEAPGKQEDGWHYFTMTPTDAYEDGKLVLKRLNFNQQNGINLIVQVAQAKFPHYFFIRRW